MVCAMEMQDDNKPLADRLKQAQEIIDAMAQARADEPMSDHDRMIEPRRAHGFKVMESDGKGFVIGTGGPVGSSDKDNGGIAA